MSNWMLSLSQYRSNDSRYTNGEDKEDRIFSIVVGVAFDMKSDLQELQTNTNGAEEFASFSQYTDPIPSTSAISHSSPATSTLHFPVPSTHLPPVTTTPHSSASTTKSHPPAANLFPEPQEDSDGFQGFQTAAFPAPSNTSRTESNASSMTPGLSAVQTSSTQDLSIR